MRTSCSYDARGMYIVDPAAAPMQSRGVIRDAICYLLSTYAQPRDIADLRVARAYYFRR